MYQNHKEKVRRGMPRDDKELAKSSSLLAKGFDYDHKAWRAVNTKAGRRQEKAYQAIKGTRSKAKSFINKLRKKRK